MALLVLLYLAKRIKIADQITKKPRHPVEAFLDLAKV